MSEKETVVVIAPPPHTNRVVLYDATNETLIVNDGQPIEVEKTLRVQSLLFAGLLQLAEPDKKSTGRGADETETQETDAEETTPTDDGESESVPNQPEQEPAPAEPEPSVEPEPVEPEPESPRRGRRKT
jgi:hypothetical protein